MSSTNKRSASLSEIVSAMLAPPSASTDEPSEPSNPPPAEVRQITPPTAEELAQIKEIAEQASELFDEIEELVGKKAGELAAKKQELRELMLSHGLKEVAIAGRNPIVLATKRDKEVTKKAITGVLGVEATNDMWGKLPIKTSHYVSIPPRNPPEA